LTGVRDKSVVNDKRKGEVSADLAKEITNDINVYKLRRSNNDRRTVK